MRKLICFILVSIQVLPCIINKSNAQLVSAATVQNGIMPVYLGYYENFKQVKPNDLERLRKAGINQLIVRCEMAATFQDVVNEFKNNIILNKFKLILNISGWTYKPYYDCRTSVTPCDLSTLPNNLPQCLTDKLDSVVQIAKANPAVVGGYYTFDEPNRQPLGNSFWSISKEYQIAIYNYIRNRDADIVDRPISLANSMSNNSSDYTLPCDAIDFSMSNDAQDIFFIDQYNNDYNLQKRWLEKWRDRGLTGKPYVFILKTFNEVATSSCAATNIMSYANAIEQAYADVFSSSLTPPVIKGVGAFAYWPAPKPDFKWDLDNCPAIMDDFCNYLSGLPTGLMAEWRLDANTNNSGPQGTAAQIIGSPENSIQYYVEGKGSLYFHGTGDGLQLSPGTGFLKNAFTARSVTFWMQPFSSSSTQILYEEGDSGNGLAVRINQGTLQVAMAAGGVDDIFTVSEFTFVDRKWYHIAIVYDNGNLKLFINGEQKLSKVTHPQIGEHWDATGLGMVITDNGLGNAFGAGDATSSYNGFFDDVQIYDVALSDEKVNFISQGLFGHWRWNNLPINEGSGNTDALVTGNYANSNPYEGAYALNCFSQRGAQLSPRGGFLTAEIKQRTIMFWMNPTVLNVNQILYEEGDSGNGIGVRLNNANNLEVAVTCFGVNRVYTLSSYQVGANTWHHVTVVFNYGEVLIYIDNVKASYTFVYPGINPKSDAAGLGIDIPDGGIGNAFGANDATGGFNGMIDDCRIYNSIIPESYIRDLCNDCRPITPARLSVSKQPEILNKDTNKGQTLYIYSTSNRLVAKSSELLKSYKLIDMSGNTLVTKSFVKACTVTIDIDHLPFGLYLIQLLNDKGEISTRKFIR